MKYTALVLAGSRPGGDGFATQFGADMKALVAVAGEPMVRRPVRALLASESVGQVIVLSQAPERMAAVIAPDPRVEFRASQPMIAQTMLEICSDPQISWPLLVTTADHPLLTSAMVDELTRAANSADVAIGVVRRASLMRRLPGTQRAWIKLRGGAYTGANLFALKSAAIRPAVELWRSVEQDRKKALRLISLLGPATLLCALVRMISLDDVLAQMGGRLGLKIKAVRLSNPLAGIDVDKPADHSLVEAILAGKA